MRQLNCIVLMLALATGLQAQSPEVLVYVPNVFTPNLDGLNDFYTIETKGISTITFTVFDRMADVIYTYDGPPEKLIWNGDSAKNGKAFQVGGYAWFLVATPSSPKQETITRSGVLMIMR